MTQYNLQSKNSLIIKSDDRMITINGIMYQNQPYTSKDKNNFINIKNGGKVWNWKGAKKYCQDLTLGEFNNWRLPTIDEIKILFSSSKHKNSKGNYFYIKEAFAKGMPNTGVAPFWSATKEDSINIKVALFHSNEIFWIFKQALYYTRCVRDIDGSNKDEIIEDTSMKNPEKSIEEYQNDCTQNDATGCLKLATIYLNGDRVTEDLDKSLKFYEKACELGNKEACESMGLVFMKMTSHWIQNNN